MSTETPSGRRADRIVPLASPRPEAPPPPRHHGPPPGPAPQPGPVSSEAPTEAMPAVPAGGPVGAPAAGPGGAPVAGPGGAAVPGRPSGGVAPTGGVAPSGADRRTATANDPAQAAGDAGAPEKTARRNGMGMPALALGLLAAGTCWTGWAGVVLGLFAVVAGYLGARRAFNGLATDGGSSLGGFVLGAIGLVVGVIVVWPTLFGTGNFGDGLTLDQCLAQSTSAKEMHMCKSQHIAEFNQRYPNAAT